MIQGYKPKSVRKRKKYSEKENVSGNSANRFTYPLSPLSVNRHVATLPTIPSPLTLNSSTLNSGHGGLRKRAAFTKTPDNTFNSTRSPLSNITNIMETNPTRPSAPTLNSVSLSAGHGALHSRSDFTKTPENTFNCTRTPLSNITNIVDNDRPKITRSYRGRNLFAEASSETLHNSKYLRDDDIECSIVQDPVLSDDSDGDEDYIPGIDIDSDTDSEQATTAFKNRIVPKEYVSLGSPESICSKCNARMWKEERINKQVTKGLPIFSICCRKGDVKLEPAPRTPAYLLQLYNNKESGPHFQRSIRLYNAMFAFTSTGENVDHSINNGRGPYVYRLNGQNHHVFGQLIPDDGHEPKYCQLQFSTRISDFLLGISLNFSIDLLTIPSEKILKILATMQI